jgi:hypothetical protein
MAAKPRLARRNVAEAAATVVLRDMNITGLRVEPEEIATSKGILVKPKPDTADTHLAGDWRRLDERIESLSSGTWSGSCATLKARRLATTLSRPELEKHSGIDWIDSPGVE